jgi:hypothetical protein
MKNCAAVVVTLALIASACHDGQTLAIEQEEGQLQTLPLTFQQSSPLAVSEVANALRGAILEQHQQTPVVFVELEFRAKTNGAYTLNPSYSSLNAFVTHMNSQYGSYTWETTTAGHVYVYPTTGAFLTKTIGPYSGSDTRFCDVVEALSAGLSTDSKRSTCMLSGWSMAGRQARVPPGIMENAWHDTKISFTVSATDARVLDIFDSILLKTGRFDAGGTRFSKTGFPHWHLNFYPSP